MMLQWLILLTLFVHNSLAFGLYDDTDDYDLWRRELGGPGVQPTSETKNDCRKDILVVLDSSQSVGALYFRSIRKFLITLVEKLNVRKDGTQIGFITFSNSTRTKKLLDVGEKTDATELIDWLKKLSYEGELMGDYTRTGLAFQIANNMFSLKSPSNARNTVEDVILLFTDGEPHSPHGNDGERKIVETETNKLKEKDVTIVAVAVGTPAQIKTFKKYIKTWVTDSSEVAETSWDTLEKDVDELVNMLFNPLCKPEAGECSCKGDSAATVTAYMKKGEITTQVEWVDAMACTGSASYTVNPPDAKSGDRFGLGEHVITYSSSYTNNAGKNVDLKCPVQVTVVTCECPSIQTVQAHHLPGVDKTSYASWTEPAPNCPAQPNPSRAHSGWFYAGETTVTHKYRVANKFDLECPVKIVVPGEFCDNTAYDPATQVCCCGKVSSKKNDGHSHRCCGQNYINPGKKMCCQGNKPVRLPGSCGP